MQDLLVFSVSWHLLRREHVLDASTSYKKGWRSSSLYLLACRRWLYGWVESRGL